MCGIAGLVLRDGAAVQPAQLAAMARALVHRGPDDEGSLLEGSLGLVMRRLAVIDVAGGRQPVFNEDRSVAVVQNGEIYNYRDLRDDLTRRGHRFATASDTEAIVHLYEETGPGPDLPARLWGMFALALYDRGRGILVLARDRAGKKPLFLYRDPRRLAFASEIGALWAPPLALDRALDPAALDAYLALQYVPGPGTVFRRVRHLPPGSVALLERRGEGWTEHAARRYWSVPARPAGDGAGWRRFGDAVDGTETLLRDAVRRRLLSDVPLGAFLSGGLDSSLVTALMTREAGGVRTFSIGFEDPRLDETPAALRVARHLATRHRTIRMPAPGPDDLAAILGRADQPLADPAIVPTWYLSRLARGEVTVALSGEGADEVFGGYHWYRRPLRERLRGGAGGPEFAARLYARREQEPPTTRASLLAPALRSAGGGCEGDRRPAGASGPPVGGAGLRSFVEAAEGAEGGAIAALQTIDFRTFLADDLVVKVDRMSMRHSLEVRCPYLDHRLVEAVLPGPDRFKIRWGRRKALLRAVALRHLPRDVVLRRKQGFQIPVADLLRSPAIRPLLGDLLSPDRVRRQGILDPGGVADLLRRFETEPERARAVWKILGLQAWLAARPETGP